jgi:phospholipase/carboxylesterase
MLESKFIAAQEPGSKRLMIVLHGLGDSIAGYAWLPQMLQLPWLNYLLVNAPDPYFGGYSWYDYQGHAEPGVRRSIGLLNQLLDAQRAAGFPSESTVLSGFSQGCLMTLETGLRYPHRLAALIGLSGYVLSPEMLLREASSVARQQRIVMTHGRQDPIIPFARVKQQAEQLRAAGLNLHWHEFDKPHTIIDDELVLIRTFLTQILGPDASTPRE